MKNSSSNFVFIVILLVFVASGMKGVEGQGKYLSCDVSSDCGSPRLCACINGRCYCIGKPVLLEQDHIQSKDQKQDHH
ncbi:hypothetical protein LINGRAHAP2_LOCUS33827 [Linum grandiflorum]